MTAVEGRLDVSGSYVFSSTTSSHDAGVALARYLRGRGWTKLAFMSSTESAGTKNPIRGCASRKCSPAI